MTLARPSGLAQDDARKAKLAPRLGHDLEARPQFHEKTPRERERGTNAQHFGPLRAPTKTNLTAETLILAKWPNSKLVKVAFTISDVKQQLEQ